MADWRDFYEKSQPWRRMKVSLDIQKKNQKGITINQENDVDNSFILNLQKRFVKAWMNLGRMNKKEIKKN